MSQSDPYCIHCESLLTPENCATSNLRRGVRTCRLCATLNARRYRELKGGFRAAYSDPRQKTLYNAKQVAKRTHIEYTLTLDTCPPVPSVCPLLGIPLEFKSQGVRHHNTPTLTRIQPHLGFTPDNVHWISQRAHQFSRSDKPVRDKAINAYRARQGLPPLEPA